MTPMPSTTFQLNGQPLTVSASADTPLLWVIRDVAGLTGTKFGCGIGLCGACTVHLILICVQRYRCDPSKPCH